MAAYPYHQMLRLRNFTAFKEAEFEFVPGINVLVGENGTGKTHLLKAIYAIQLTLSRDLPNIWEPLQELFQTRYLADVVRMGTAKDVRAEANGVYNHHEWSYSIGHDTMTACGGSREMIKPERPVFIPAIDMMGHTRGFTEAYSEVRLDFDLTCRDIVNLLRLERRNGNGGDGGRSGLVKLLGGDIVYDDEGRYYLVTKLGRQPMPMISEGLRKIATLVQLERNGWLAPGSTLFWDEPEVNLNPVLMDELIGELLTLARSGVQVFLATHSYVILKELDLQATLEDNVRFFSLKGDKTGTQVMATDTFTGLKPNPILQQYGSLYDRDISRATGRKPRSEKVR